MTKMTRGEKDALLRSLLSLAVFTTTLVLSTTAWADPHADKCTKEIEKAFNQCTDGKHEVWYYDFRETGNSVPSGPYKSGEKAQSALKADRELCQLVDRYFQHTDCQTQYEDVYCAACGSDAAKTADTNDSIVQLALNNAAEQLDRLLDEVKSLAKSIRSIENNGPSDQFAGVGNATKEYVRLLKDAKSQARQLQELMGKVAAGQKNLLDQLDKATKDLSDQFGPLDAAKAHLSEEIGKATNTSPEASTDSGPSSWNYHFEPMVWEAVSVDQKVTISSNSISSENTYGGKGRNDVFRTDGQTCPISANMEVGVVKDVYGDGRLFTLSVGPGAGNTCVRNASSDTQKETLNINYVEMEFPSQAAADKVVERLQSLKEKASTAAGAK